MDIIYYLELSEYVQLDLMTHIKNHKSLYDFMI